jgi:hypothetical protein
MGLRLLHFVKKTNGCEEASPLSQLTLKSSRILRTPWLTPAEEMHLDVYRQLEAVNPEYARAIRDATIRTLRRCEQERDGGANEGPR